MSLGRTPKAKPLVSVVSVDATEDSHTLREHARAFQVRCNDFEQLRIAFVSGETADGGDYFVLNPGEVWWEDDLSAGGAPWTLYLRAPDAASAVDVSILEWQ